MQEWQCQQFHTSDSFKALPLTKNLKVFAIIAEEKSCTKFTKKHIELLYWPLTVLDLQINIYARYVSRRENPHISTSVGYSVRHPLGSGTSAQWCQGAIVFLILPGHHFQSLLVLISVAKWQYMKGQKSNSSRHENAAKERNNVFNMNDHQIVRNVQIL